MVKNLAVRVHSFDEGEVKNGFKNIKVPSGRNPLESLSYHTAGMHCKQHHVAP